LSYETYSFSYSRLISDLKITFLNVSKDFAFMSPILSSFSHTKGNLFIIYKNLQ